MRISRFFLNSSLVLSLPLLAQAQQPGAPAIPRAEPAAAAPATQPPRTLPAPATQPGQPQAQPTQPGQPQPGQPSQLQPNRVTVNKPVAGEQSNQQASKQVATLLAICNQKEVKLAEMAKSKSENKDVREFAEMMIKDHSDMISKLSQHGGQPGLSSTTGSNSASQPATATRPADQNRPATTAGTTMAGGLDFVAVQRQAAQQCLSKAEKKWNEGKAAECDMAYIGAQVVAHEEMINQATALRPYASPELQKEIDRGIETAEQHRDEAHKLIKKLGEQEKRS